MLFLATLLLTDGGKDLIVKPLNSHALFKHIGPLLDVGVLFLHYDWKARILPKTRGSYQEYC